MDRLSLLEFCKECGSECCRSSGEIGSPILTWFEKSKIRIMTGILFFQKRFEKIRVLGKGTYYIIGKRWLNKRDCRFLRKGKCLIQDYKPLDCRSYPIKAIRRNGEVILVIDPKCPASKRLTSDFIKAAKEVAFQSIDRFDPAAYQHWLDHYLGWLDYAIELDTFLALSNKEKSALVTY